MDPVSQGVLGALAAQSFSERKMLAKCGVIGVLAGMSPDLDVLIRSSQDSLLALQYHRQFTHSLFFIPVGGPLVGWLLYALLGRRWQLTFKQVLLCSTMGFATHGLLDWCTSYGTQLLWPFSEQRFALDIISIIDPLFTVPLLLLVVVAARRHSKKWLVIAWLWCAVYLSIATLQHQRALDMGEQLAAQRGHTIVRLEVKPSFANLAVWKVIYETEQRFFVAAVKPGLRESQVWPGDSVRKLDLQQDLPWLSQGSRQAQDIERFSKFSMGYLALDPNDKTRVVDMRYSLLPDQVKPLWGVKLQPQSTGQHVKFYTERGDGRASLMRLLEMLNE